MQNINDEFGMWCRSWQMNFWKFFNDENWELYWNFLAVKYSPENYENKMDSRVRSDGVRPKIKNPEDERVNFFLIFWLILLNSIFGMFLFVHVGLLWALKDYASIHARLTRKRENLRHKIFLRINFTMEDESPARHQKFSRLKS